MTGTSGPTEVSTKLARIAELARESPARVLTTLAHHVDVGFLVEAYRRTRKDGAAGVDGRTGAGYGERLEENLRDLLERFKSGSYHAPPVRRVNIPKGDGKTRPLGIPTFEDKVLQRAVAMLLEAVYEQDFKDCSHGFRPGRSAHGALEELWQGLMDTGGGWVVDVDIQSFFDTIDHGHLRSFLDRRMRDGVLRRTLDKWLKAGVLEDGSVSYRDEGTPQGGVISPLLANIYLHEVLDGWYDSEVKPRLKGRSFLIRYADDFVIACELEDDARRVMAVLPKRFGRYGLTLHPTKTRLVDFRRPATRRGDDDEPGSFDLLGFTHYWGKSKRGQWVVRRKTARSRFTRALARVSDWCRANLHAPVAEQWRQLVTKLQGHAAYYGISGNAAALARYRHEVERTWLRWLARRNQRGLRWPEAVRLLRTHRLPTLRLRHPLYLSQHP
jgi:group II intron reverse transcriptase/maturase